MKKLFLFIVSALFFVSANAQKKVTDKKFDVKVEGSILNFSGNYVYLHYKLGELEQVDSSKVVSGKFLMKLKASEPTLYWLSIIKTPVQPTDNVFFFADKSPIKADLRGDSISLSTITGGQSQIDYTEYRNFINSLVMIQQKMQSDFNLAIQNNDVNTQNAIKAEYQNLNAQYINGLKTFIKTHPSSPVSAYILCNDFSAAGIPIAEVIEAETYMDKSLANTSYMMTVNKRINDSKGTTVGYTATNFSQATPEGKEVSLTDFRGKYVLIDFWASWCKPCRMENPNVVAAYNRYKDKNFTVLGVSFDSKRDAWLMAIQQDNLTWTHVSDLKGWGNEVGKVYGVTGIPQNYLIDKEGKIVAKDLRGEALDEKLAEIIK